MAAVGRTSLFVAGFAPTAVGTVTLSAIAGTADIENATTSLRTTKRVTENNFRCAGHPRLKAGLDNGHQSWQLGVISVGGVSDMSSPATDLGRYSGRGLLSSASRKTLHRNQKMMYACGAGMMLRVYYFGESSENCGFK